jgi:hypothetical protein
MLKPDIDLLKRDVQAFNRWRTKTHWQWIVLSNADLSYADLRNADLRNAVLRNADFSYADLSYADLRNAVLRNAVLRYADLRNAVLRYADLSYAVLRNADLSYADLSYADLRNAVLVETKVEPFQVGQTGALVVWGKKKHTDGAWYLVKLWIPASARRTACLINRKCRAERVKTLWIESGLKRLEVVNNYSTTVYEVGEYTEPHEYNDDIRIDCAPGIHFFRTEEEARSWDGDHYGPAIVTVGKKEGAGVE